MSWLWRTQWESYLFVQTWRIVPYQLFIVIPCKYSSYSLVSHVLWFHFFCIRRRWYQYKSRWFSDSTHTKWNFFHISCFVFLFFFSFYSSDVFFSLSHSQVHFIYCNRYNNAITDWQLERPLNILASENTLWSTQFDIINNKKRHK